MTEAKTIATRIVKKLTEAGYLAYFAGGWVRDLEMGHPSNDIDIATNASPDEIIHLFPKTVPVGISFGVVIVLSGGYQFEVSTFRRDCDYADGRRPLHIELTNPEEDAKRRDFTINGMFYDPLADQVIDYVDGRKDIREKIIRTIGDPYDRFKEDRLRMIRAVRFAARFGFVIDDSTRLAIKEFAGSLFPSVSIERVWQELKKMAEGPHFDAAIVDLHQLGLLQTIFPTLIDVPVEQIQKRTAAYAHFPEKCPPILFIAQLFGDTSLKDLLNLCLYLKISNEETRMAELFFRGKELIRKQEDDWSWAHYLADPRSQFALEAIFASYPPNDRMEALKNCTHLRSKLESHIDRIARKAPLVNAESLKKEGIAPGKLMGALLKEAEKVAINRNLYDPKQVLEVLKSSALWKKE